MTYDLCVGRTLIPSLLTPIQQNFDGLNSDGSFILPDLNSFLGPYDPTYETSVIKFLNVCFHAVIFFFFL